MFPKTVACYMKKIQEQEKLREVIDGDNTPKMTDKSRYKYLKYSHSRRMKDPSSESSVYFGLSLIQYVVYIFRIIQVIYFEGQYANKDIFLLFLFAALFLNKSELVVQDEKTIMTEDPFEPLLTEIVGKCNNSTIVIFLLRCHGFFFE